MKMPKCPRGGHFIIIPTSQLFRCVGTVVTTLGWGFQPFFLYQTQRFWMMKILIPFFKVLEKGLHLESSWVILNLFNYWSSMGFVVFPKWPRRSPAKLKKPHFHKYTPENPHFSIPKTAIFFKAGGGVESTFFPSGPYHFGYIYPAVRFVGGKSPF